MLLDNLFTLWKSVQALKERGIAVTETVQKSAAGYPSRLLMFKIANRALEWGHLEATIIHGIACWLWQDQNAVIDKFFSFFIIIYYISPNSWVIKLIFD